MSIQKTLNHNLEWKDVEHQIYDENSNKVYEIRFLGIKVYRIENTVIANHEILKAGKKIGFISDDKVGEQARVVDKATSQRI